jgi:hypothetical protein
MLPVRPEMQKAGPSTSVTVPPLPRGGLAVDVQGLVTDGHDTRRGVGAPRHPRRDARRAGARRQKYAEEREALRSGISTTAIVELQWGYV